MGLLTNLSLFSGVGGLDLAAKWTGKIKTVCYVEQDHYAQAVLQSRFRDGRLEDAPIWEDVTTFDGLPWRGKVDIISGGFPCQDLSYAGKGAGIQEGKRSGLWREFSRIIREVRPRFVLVENVSGLIRRGLAVVLSDLAQSGYNAQWFCLSAGSVGAPHRRNRVWLVAYPQHTNPDVRGPHRAQVQLQREAQLQDQQDRNFGQVCQDVADPTITRLSDRRGAPDRRPKKNKQFERRGCKNTGVQTHTPKAKRSWWSIEPDVGRVAHGVVFRVDRLRCCGNGVVPQQALPAWEKIIEMAESI